MDVLSPPPPALPEIGSRRSTATRCGKRIRTCACTADARTTAVRCNDARPHSVRPATSTGGRDGHAPRTHARRRHDPRRHRARRPRRDGTDPRRPGADLPHPLHAEPPGGCERRERVRGLLARRCPSSAAILLGVGAIADLLMGEDSRWWPVAVGPAIIGLVMVVVSLVLITVREAGIRFFHRPQLDRRRVCGPRAPASPSALWRSFWWRQARTPAGCSS